MAELTLISQYEGAISEALRSTMAGISRGEERLREFEAQYSMASTDFLERYENDELPETLELAEWIGEIKMLQRLQDKVDRRPKLSISSTKFSISSADQLPDRSAWAIT